MTEDPEAFFAWMAGQAGTVPITAAEAEATLRLAKVVADRWERRLAPLTCYAAGLSIGAAPGPDRLERLRSLIGLLEGAGAEHDHG
jgi:hypothetical protein